jgi:dTDP-4-amino-4,6-dideoxygalactose transaminase
MKENMENEFKIPMSKPNFGKEETDVILQVLKSDWPSQGKVTQELTIFLLVLL